VIRKYVQHFEHADLYSTISYLGSNPGFEISSSYIDVKVAN
jgi:hypothetical protein